MKKAEAARAVPKADTPIARTDAVAPAGTDLAAQGNAPYDANCKKCRGVLGVPPKTM